MPLQSGPVHVVELQLNLQCMFDMSSDEGHARYIESRNRAATEGSPEPR